jgi:hypothetical protein
MPKTARTPKVFLSDDPVIPEQVLPRRNAQMADGDPETEQPYNPIPKRPGEGEPVEPPEDPSVEPPEEEPVIDPDIDGDDGEEENTPPPDQPGEPPAAKAAGAAVTPPRLGSSYSAPVDQAPLHPPTVTYRSRIAVVEAWRYPGQLAEAPTFIDRAWTAWAEADLYGATAGPALRVPVTRSLSGPVPLDGFKLCRIGDYVVRQMVTLVDGFEPEEALDVWPKDDFERLFMPVKIRKPDPQWTENADAA